MGFVLEERATMWLKFSHWLRIANNHQPLLERGISFTAWGWLHWPASPSALFCLSSFQLKNRGILQRTVEPVYIPDIVCNLDKLYAYVSMHNHVSSRYRWLQVPEFKQLFLTLSVCSIKNYYKDFSGGLVVKDTTLPLQGSVLMGKLRSYMPYNAVKKWGEITANIAVNKWVHNIFNKTKESLYPKRWHPGLSPRGSPVPKSNLFWRKQEELDSLGD